MENDNEYRKLAETWIDGILSEQCPHVSSLKMSACNRCLIAMLTNLAELKVKVEIVNKSNLKHLFIMKKLLNTNIKPKEQKLLGTGSYSNDVATKCTDCGSYMYGRAPGGTCPHAKCYGKLLITPEGSKYPQKKTEVCKKCNLNITGSIVIVNSETFCAPCHDNILKTVEASLD